MNKKLLTSLLIILALVGVGVINWNFVLGMLGIGGDSTMSLNKGLIAHYPLAQEDLKSATVIADLTPNGNDGTITAGAGGFTTDRKGQANKAYDFDGANTKIDIGTDIIGISAKSISAWIYLNSWGGGNYGRIFDNGKLKFYVDGNDSANRLLFSSDGAITIASSANDALSLSTWYHIVVTRDATGASTLFYINEVESDGSDPDSGTPEAGTTDVILGSRDADNGRVFDGSISDVRIYNRVLSTSEISLLYESYNPKTAIGSLEKGLVGNWKLDQASETWNANLVPSASSDFATNGSTYWTAYNGSRAWNGTDKTLEFSGNAGNYSGIYRASLPTVGSTIRVTFRAKSSTFSSAMGAYCGTNNWGDSLVTGVTNPSMTSEFQTYVFQGVCNTGSKLVLRSPSTHITAGDVVVFDDIVVTPLVTADDTPYANHGTTVGVISTTDRKAQANKAMEFDGTDDYIDVGDTSQTSINSVSFWIEPDSTSEDIMDLDGGTHTVEVGAGTLTATGFDTPTLYVNGSAGATLTADTWYHVVITTATGIDTNNFDIGRIAASYFDGKLADVRLYDRVLTTAEITELYQSYDRKLKTGSLNKGLIGYWPLKTKYYNPATERLDDISAYSNHGTLTPGTGSVGADYTDFDGADTTIPTTLTSNTGFTSGFSVSAWIKPENSGEAFGRIVDKSEGSTGNDGFVLAGYTDNKLYFSVDGGTLISPATNAIEYGVWQHVVLTVASNALATYYVNNSVSGTPATTKALSNIITNNPLTIGNRSSASDGTFDGNISDVRIYDRVLSTDEIALLYKMGR